MTRRQNLAFWVLPSLVAAAGACARHSVAPVPAVAPVVEPWSSSTGTAAPTRPNDSAADSGSPIQGAEEAELESRIGGDGAPPPPSSTEPSPQGTTPRPAPR